MLIIILGVLQFLLTEA